MTLCRNKELFSTSGLIYSSISGMQKNLLWAKFFSAHVSPSFSIFCFWGSPHGNKLPQLEKFWRFWAHWFLLKTVWGFPPTHEDLPPPPKKKRASEKKGCLPSIKLGQKKFYFFSTLKCEQTIWRPLNLQNI